MFELYGLPDYDVSAKHLFKQCEKCAVPSAWFLAIDPPKQYDIIEAELVSTFDVSMPAVRTHTMAYADEIDSILNGSTLKEFKVVLGTEHLSQWEASINRSAIKAKLSATQLQIDRAWPTMAPNLVNLKTPNPVLAGHDMAVAFFCSVASLPFTPNRHYATDESNRHLPSLPNTARLLILSYLVLPGTNAESFREYRRQVYWKSAARSLRTAAALGSA